MDTERMLSTGQVAKRLGVNVRTVYRWEDAGRLHPVRLPTGQRRFSSREVDGVLRVRAVAAPRCAVYARVSSEKQVEAGNLDRQRERLLAAAAERGFEVVAAVTERASGLNEKRRGLRRLFRMAAAREIDVVLAEFKDRLARFGFAYVVEALAAHGVRVEVLDGPVAVDATQELVQDMLAIVTCFAARLYGSRSQQFRKKVQEAAKEAEGLAG
jgi:putative resolvase